MHITVGIQALSFTGALLILIAYMGHQFGWMNPQGRLYNVLNAAGSAILGYIALRPFQLGFTILEWTWVAISLYALLRAAKRRRAAAATES